MKTKLLIIICASLILSVGCKDYTKAEIERITELNNLVSELKLLVIAAAKNGYEKGRNDALNYAIGITTKEQSQKAQLDFYINATNIVKF